MKPKLMFTAGAFYQALARYGEDLFLLNKDYGPLYVTERALLDYPLIKTSHFPDPIPMLIKKHWFDIKDPPPNGESGELNILIEQDKFYPDNVIIFVDNLREFSILNRSYGHDDLKSIDQLQFMISNCRK